MAKVNYVIAAWTGVRVREDPRYTEDRSLYLRKHMEQLRSVRHSLDQVTVVLAEGGDTVADAFVLGLGGGRVRDTPIVVMARKNEGYSYGSWNHCFESFGTRFDYYIIVEDDYAPVLEGFDQVLVSIAKEKRTYVCGMATMGGRHAAISNGVIPSEVWSVVHPAPYVCGRGIGAGNSSQSVWSQHFHDSGFPVQDTLDCYSSPFWARGSSLKTYGDGTLPPIFVPVHTL